MIKRKSLKRYLMIILPIIIFSVLFIFIMDKTNPTDSNEDGYEEYTQEELEELAESMESTSDSTGDFEEFIVEDIEVGNGIEVKEGDVLKVHYIGTLIDGTQFDSSYDRGEPFEFTIGEGSVIEGWDEGLIGMKVGGKRKLSIPSELGYGEIGSSSIPPNAGLIFEVELIEIVE